MFFKGYWKKKKKKTWMADHVWPAKPQGLSLSGPFQAEFLTPDLRPQGGEVGQDGPSACTGLENAQDAWPQTCGLSSATSGKSRDLRRPGRGRGRPSPAPLA